MKRSELKLLCRWAIILVSVAIVTRIFIFSLINNAYIGILTPHEASSIAIIGGSDGSASTFVATRINDQVSYIYLTLIIVIIALAIALQNIRSK